MTPSPIAPVWLVRLRWSALLAQCLLLLGVHFLFHAPFALAPSLAITGALAVANVALALWLRSGRPLTPRGLLLHLLLDIGALTGLLAFTGGAMNPFTTLYLLHVALAALMLPRGLSLAVLVAAAVAFATLLFSQPEAIHIWHSGQMFILHVRGMWLVFTLTGAALWYFIHRVADALRRREAELAQARLLTERAHRVASLGHLAAGAAHELNTPLGTVAVAAAELSEMLASQPEAQAQADVIRAQVRRCRQIFV